MLGTFHRWRDPERVRALATLAILTRDGAEVGAASTAGLPGGPPLFVPTRRVDVSSTEIRARVRAGRSIRGFVPEAVADFIRSAGLYR